MVHVNAWVNGLEGTVGLASFHVATNGVLAHVEWNNLFKVECVFNHNDSSHIVLVGVLVRIVFFLLCAVKF